MQIHLSPFRCQLFHSFHSFQPILRSPGGSPQADKLLGGVWVTLEPIYVLIKVLKPLENAFKLLKMAHFSLLNVYVPPMFT